jgi:hypothetical protein
MGFTPPVATFSVSKLLGAVGSDALEEDELSITSDVKVEEAEGWFSP